MDYWRDREDDEDAENVGIAEYVEVETSDF